MGAPVGVYLASGSEEDRAHGRGIGEEGDNPQRGAKPGTNGRIVGCIPLFDLALPAISLPLALLPGPATLLIEGSRMTLTMESASA